MVRFLLFRAFLAHSWLFWYFLDYIFCIVIRFDRIYWGLSMVLCYFIGLFVGFLVVDDELLNYFFQLGNLILEWLILLWNCVILDKEFVTLLLQPVIFAFQLLVWLLHFSSFLSLRLNLWDVNTGFHLFFLRVLFRLPG